MTIFSYTRDSRKCNDLAHLKRNFPLFQAFFTLHYQRKYYNIIVVFITNNCCVARNFSKLLFGARYIIQSNKSNPKKLPKEQESTSRNYFINNNLLYRVKVCVLSGNVQHLPDNNAIARIDKLIAQKETRNLQLISKSIFYYFFFFIKKKIINFLPIETATCL